MFDYKKLRINLYTYRKKLKLTQAQLAEKADISDKSISNIESGKNQPRLSTIIAILNAYNITLADMIDLDGSTDEKEIFINDIHSYIKDMSMAEKKYLLSCVQRLNNMEINNEY